MSLKRVLIIGVVIMASVILLLSTTSRKRSNENIDSSVENSTTESTVVATSLEVGTKIMEAETTSVASTTDVLTIGESANLSTEAKKVKTTEWQGEVLNRRNGVVNGPSGKESYYNLDMSGVIRIMENLGYNYEYHIQENGVKMYGPYIMCAANLDLRPRGTLVETTLGTAIVCDTGTFAKDNPWQLDIAVDW